MDVAIPVYVETFKQPGQGTRHRCRPLFRELPSVEHESLERAMAKLSGELRKAFDDMGRADRHEELADWVFDPDVEGFKLSLTLDLRDRHFKCRYFFAVLEALGRRIAMCPNLPSLWFDLERGEELETRAREIVSEHFRRLARADMDIDEYARDTQLHGSAWLTSIDLAIHPRQNLKRSAEATFAALFGSSVQSGSQELHRVGRNLHDWYPDKLQRAIFREPETTKLLQALRSPDRRPIAVVGKRLVGKTTVIHEAVYQRIVARKKRSSNQQTWLISPQRLISGMSFVGEWENRLLAILNHVRSRGHVLYFDDLLGMYQAGISRDSNLSAAEVLKTHVGRREFRLISEWTPESFAAFQERDRGFADQFQVIQVNEPNEEESLAILISVVRRLEAQFRCSFALDVLPTLLQLSRQQMRDAAFPGKAATMLERLAAKQARREIYRHDLYTFVEKTTGVSRRLLDNQIRLFYENIVEALQQKVIGQSPALEALADVVTVAKARLNDEHKPLASLVFVGPTGVGKTQAAKAIAEYLFNSESRLIRFDMNEFTSADAVARLTGTFADPDGAMTSAVRRTPFCVILLDEIEKAHPDVFDLLLQVFGEARLTDSLGRTADFSNAILIMTSNLGVREASRSVGFKQGGERAFVKAAESFFRPEFVNRLDRIVPFSSLSREHIENIAHLLIHDIMNREGLSRRRCVLNIDESAMNRIVDEGFHPTMGARALKRTLERQITTPIALQLSGWKPETPAVLNISSKNGEIASTIQELRDAERTSWDYDELSTADVLTGSTEFVQRCQDTLAERRVGGSISIGDLSPEQLAYYALQQSIAELNEQVGSLEQKLEERRQRSTQFSSGARPPTPGNPVMGDYTASPRPALRQVMAAADIDAFISEVSKTSEAAAREADLDKREVLEAMLLLERMVNGSAQHAVFLKATPLRQRDSANCEKLLNEYTSNLAVGFEFSVKRIDDAENTLLIEGPYVDTLLGDDSFIHLVVHGNDPYPIRMDTAISKDATVPIRLRELQQSPNDQLPRVQFITNSTGQTIDLSSGMTGVMESGNFLRRSIAYRTRPPRELEQKE